MAISDDKIRELKLAAKWATDSTEKKRALAELSQYGRQALPAIEEVLGVTAYDDIKAACIEAIKAAGKSSQNKAVSTKKAKRSSPKRRKGKKK